MLMLLDPHVFVINLSVANLKNMRYAKIYLK